MESTCSSEEQSAEGTYSPAPNSAPPKKPVITEEEDKPFSETQLTERAEIYKILREQQHNQYVEGEKISVGKTLMYGCLIGVALMVVVDIIWSPDSDLLTGAFDLAKTVATIVLGYLFGSKSK